MPALTTGVCSGAAIACSGSTRRGLKRTKRRSPLALTLGLQPLLSCAPLCAAAQSPQGAVIFLHGSGDSGEGLRQYWEAVDSTGLLGTLRDSGVSVYFPDSGVRPYRLAGGQPVSVWFDRTGLPPSSPEDTASVEDSVDRLMRLVSEIKATGVQAHRIAVGGFSMGGGIALQLALRHPESVGAVFALSSYMCDDASILRKLEALQKPPAFPPVLMAHGDADNFIRMSWGKGTAARLRALGCKVEFLPLPRAGHELTTKELAVVSKWLISVLQSDKESCAANGSSS